ncbi:MAG: DedA family protein [Roseburia sp.]|nr:DedA family protein [Ruminococcus sp.]MCM1156520.1 DedA family protein [Roseburia sp.]MCM1242436.1 DedA family protein [Roseburia sp.]
MTIDTLTLYFTRYGAVAIFIIVLLEYMNMPGFPAGVIMPLSGVWAAKGNIHFINVMFITLAAGLSGSWILYFLGRTGGNLLLEKYLHKFPKHREAIEKNFAIIRKKGCFGIFLSKLIPMVRTLISIPAGVLKINFLKYTISSALGVFVWNLVFVGAGYVLGDAVFTYLK